MTGVLLFELFVIVFTIVLFVYMSKSGHKNVAKKFVIMFIGILLFEIMSEPMWRNYLLHPWAYLYGDVSWLITLGWTDMFFVSMILVDKYNEKASEIKKFWLNLLFITIITSITEVVLLKAGMRGYVPVLTSKMSGLNIPFTNAPIEIVPTIPIIAALVITFYKYFNRLFKDKS